MGSTQEMSLHPRSALGACLVLWWPSLLRAERWGSKGLRKVPGEMGAFWGRGSCLEGTG